MVAALLATVVLGTAASGPAAGRVPPSADPGAPTPTAPHDGLPPQGSAPDGSTVGGQRLAARGIVVAPGTPALPGGLAASGWLVADADTGEVLAARDPHGRYYPASTLKLLTLLALAPLLDPTAVVEGTVEDEAIEGSKVGLVEGGRYRVQVLLLGLVLQSGNDAANALARAAGGVPATLEAMNATAGRLGAFDTVAGSPSGLDVAGQSSSPYDLALILVAVLAEPALAEMPPVAGRSPGYQIQNQNPLAAYPGNLGGKTGFTDAARHTFVGAAERDGRRLVVSVMSTEPRPLRAAEQATRLLNWGFTLPADVEGVGVLVAPGEVPAEAPEPTAVPTTVPTAEPTDEPLAPRLPDAAAAGLTAGTDPGRDSGRDSPLLPVALTGAAALVVVATALGVQRALRPVRPPRRRGRRATAPGPPEGSPSRRS